MSRSPRVFYTSDIHLGHGRVADLRGFTSTRDHDRAIADGWRSEVTDRDTVYVLGDVAVSGFTYALEFLAGLPGRKHLIAGNHDPVHPMHRRTFAGKLPAFLDVFETVSPFLRRKLAGRELLLSHFPYVEWGDGPGREGSRYEQYRLPDLGTPLLHGHTHGTEQGHGHSLHIGVDAWGLAPVSQDHVIDWLDELASYRSDASIARANGIELAPFTWTPDDETLPYDLRPVAQRPEELGEWCGLCRECCPPNGYADAPCGRLHDCLMCEAKR
jgi:calcineurin-like phosphoesterase family protein